MKKINQTAVNLDKIIVAKNTYFGLDENWPFSP